MNFRKPLVVVNFKTYKEATGANALKLARACERVARKYNKTIVVCPQAADISISSRISIPVFSQHVDAIEYGKNTGFILPESAKAAGARGTLLNHSEHRLDFDVLRKSMKRAKEAGLTTVVCVKVPSEVKKVRQLNPDFIAIEPPELIGGNISVSTAKPEVISGAVRAAGRIPVLCGAGVHTREDVEIALKLGAVGVLVASGVVLARSPEKVLTDLVSD